MTKEKSSNDKTKGFGSNIILSIFQIGIRKAKEVATNIQDGLEDFVDTVNQGLGKAENTARQEIKDTLAEVQIVNKTAQTLKRGFKAVGLIKKPWYERAWGNITKTFTQTLKAIQPYVVGIFDYIEETAAAFSGYFSSRNKYQNNKDQLKIIDRNPTIITSNPNIGYGKNYINSKQQGYSWFSGLI